jgi:hypothetical protein
MLFLVLEVVEMQSRTEHLLCLFVFFGERVGREVKMDRTALKNLKLDISVGKDGYYKP